MGIVSTYGGALVLQCWVLNIFTLGRFCVLMYREEAGKLCPFPHSNFFFFWSWHAWIIVIPILKTTDRPFWRWFMMFFPCIAISLLDDAHLFVFSRPPVTVGRMPYSPIPDTRAGISCR